MWSGAELLIIPPLRWCIVVYGVRRMCMNVVGSYLVVLVCCGVLVEALVVELCVDC